MLIRFSFGSPFFLGVGENRWQNVCGRGEQVTDASQFSLESVGLVFNDQKHVKIAFCMSLTSGFGIIDHYFLNSSRMLFAQSFPVMSSHAFSSSVRSSIRYLPPVFYYPSALITPLIRALFALFLIGESGRPSAAFRSADISITRSPATVIAALN
jgi:hypothetical protein